MSKAEESCFENGKEDTTEGTNAPISSVVEDHGDPLLHCDQDDENLVQAQWTDVSEDKKLNSHKGKYCCLQPNSHAITDVLGDPKGEKGTVLSLYVLMPWTLFLAQYLIVIFNPIQA